MLFGGPGRLRTSLVPALDNIENVSIWNGPIMVLERTANPSIVVIRFLGSSPSHSAKIVVYPSKQRITGREFDSRLVHQRLFILVIF